MEINKQKKSNEQILDEMHFLDDQGKSINGENSQWVQWISVKDRLPLQMPENIPTMNWVIVTTSHYPNQVSIARFDGERWEFLDTDSDWTYGAICGDCTSAFDIKEITHWMPLPEPPKE